MSEFEVGHAPGTEVMRVEVGELAGLEAQSRAEMDVQISTAKAYPRSLTAFKREAFDLVTLDRETAGACFYTMKRGGKSISGPSVRFAEIIAYAWGNMRFEAKVTQVTEREVVAQGTALDLEKNMGSRIEVRRRITKKDGSRFDDDMITVTSNAACSIALRNAIFDVIPFALAKPLYEASRKTAAGEGKEMAKRREEHIKKFEAQGVDRRDIYAVLGVDGMDDVGTDQLLELIGIRNAIDNGDTTIEETFARAGKARVSKQDADSINKELGLGEHKETDAEVKKATKLVKAALKAGSITQDYADWYMDAIKAGNTEIIRDIIRDLEGGHE
jgi:hypothetical protein